VSLLRHTFPVGPLACNCTILADTAAGEAIVIDPGDDVSTIVQYLHDHHLRATQIIVTHAHIDHVGGAQKLKALTGAPVLLNSNDVALLRMMDIQAGWIGVRTPDVADPDADLTDGTRIAIGSQQGTVLHTPGHTEGSVCVYFPATNLLFAGDTLFAGSIGRTDLPGGDSRAIIRSIHDKLLPLPDATLVVAGHGPDTTIGDERAENPFLQRL
jgi:hydroxyacylglutathione hydrolase